MRREKWRIRKQGGWQVWRPNEIESCATFPSFDHLLLWRPDCEWFLNGWCHCRNECAQ